MMRNLKPISGKTLESTELKKIKGGILWSGDCAVHHENGNYWKMISPWTYPGSGTEAEAACTTHVRTEEAGAYCFCNYY